MHKQDRLIILRAGWSCLAFVFYTAALAPLIVSLSGCTHDDRLARWESARHAAFLAFRDHRYEQAKEKYRTAIAVARECPGADKHVPIAQVELAGVYATQRDLPAAQAMYEAAIVDFNKGARGAKSSLADMDTSMPPDIVHYYCDALSGLAKVQQKLGQRRESEMNFQRAYAVAAAARLQEKSADIAAEFQQSKLAVGSTAGNSSAGNSAAGKDNAVQGQSDRYDKLCRAGAKSFSGKHYDLAVQNYLDAAKIAQMSHSQIGQADCAVHLGAAYSACNDLVKAERCYRFAESIYKYQIAHMSVDNLLLGQCLQGLAAVLIKEGKAAQAVSVAQSWRESVQRAAGSDQELIEANSLLARAFVAAGNFQPAIVCLQQALKLTRKRYSPSCATVVMYSCWISHLYFLNHQPELGRQIISGLITQLENQPAENCLLPARLYNDYGQAINKQGYRQEAAEYYRAALSILARMPREQTERQRAKRLLAGN